MRRFELVEGSSSKFWEIGLEGSSFTVVYGRIGTSGTTQTKSFDDDTKAKKEHDKLVAEKTKKGYSEVGADASANAAPTSATAAAPKAAKAQKPKSAPVDDADEASAPVAKAAPAAAAPVAPPVEAEDQVFWTDALTKRAFPRRGGVVVPFKVPTAVAALNAVKKAMTARAELAKTIADQQRSGHEAIARLTKAVEAGKAPADVDDASVLLCWFGMQPTYRVPHAFDDAVDWLVGGQGVALATGAIVRSMERSFRSPAYSGTSVVELLETPADHWSSSFEGGRSWRGLDRLRCYLVAASDADYAAALAAARPLRKSMNERVASSVLFPDADFVTQDLEDCLSAQPGYLALLASVSKLEQVPATSQFSVNNLVDNNGNGIGADLAATLIDGLGRDAAVLFARATAYDGDQDVRWYEAIGAIGSDETVGVVAQHLSQKAAQAALADIALFQPRRVMRLTAKAAAARGKSGDPARAVLSSLVRRLPELVAEVTPFLDAEGVRGLAAVVADQGEAVADAAPADVPSFLASPPWHAKKAKAAGAVLLDVKVTPLPPSMVWLPKEREKWEQRGGSGSKYDENWWRQKVNGNSTIDVDDLANAPTEWAERFAERVHNRWSDTSYYPRAVARHELAILPLYTARIAAAFAEVIDFLVPVGVDAFAMPMATALATKKSMRDSARQWLLRHPRHAANGVLATAVGKVSKDREYAEDVLRLLAKNGHEQTVLDLAAVANVKDAVVAILAASPFDKFPAKVPKLATWLDAQSLPRPVLKGGKGALSIAATSAVLEMVAFSSLDDPYAGIEALKEACEPKSLARLAWATLSTWLVNGASSKEGYGLNIVGFFGDDDCARKLAAYAREWPGEAAHARAVSALDVLAVIGSDVALMHLNAIALKSKFKGLQTKAQGKIELIAETRGLSREELEDRLAPDLGLDDDGSMKLDFGTRWFTVGFDEALRPFVKDHEGARLKDLPKPKASDDGEKAKAAAETWGQLKKDAKQAASLQILRLELAMCGQRRFDAAGFNELFVQHPLVVHIVRRLVWGTYLDGKLTNTFRVAEDRSCADGNDDAFSIPDGVTVGIPHPLELDDATSGKWSQVFGDYELVQPFAQLGRPTFVADEAQRASKVLDVVKGITVKTGKVLGLEQRRWRRGAPQDGGVVCWMEKQLADGRTVTLDLEQGIYTGMIAESPEQTLGSAVVGSSSRWGGVDRGDAFGTLDAIAYSELVRDLEGLKG
jgi:predicted DNA-binding WGR domain protein